jgi:hypothetical protein
MAGIFKGIPVGNLQRRDGRWESFEGAMAGISQRDMAPDLLIITPAGGFF